VTLTLDRIIWVYRRVALIDLYAYIPNFVEIRKNVDERTDIRTNIETGSNSEQEQRNNVLDLWSSKAFRRRSFIHPRYKVGLHLIVISSGLSAKMLSPVRLQGGSQLAARE